MVNSNSKINKFVYGIDQMELCGTEIVKMELTPCLTHTIIYQFQITINQLDQDGQLYVQQATMT